MNLRQIEVFRAVMQAGSVTAPAGRRFVAQPGVSRRRALVDLQWGGALLPRRKGRLHATAEAETLYAQIERVYGGVREIDDCARSLRQGQGLVLRVLCSPSLGLALVPRAMAETAARFPGARFTLEAQLAREMAGLLMRGQADLGLSNVPIDHPGLQAQAVGRWHLSCAFPAGHVFESRGELTPPDILAEPLIAFGADTPQGRAIADWCRQSGLEPKSRIEVRSGPAACALAASGAGVAVVDSLTAQAWRDPGLRFRPVKSGAGFQAWALRSTQGLASAPQRFLVERVRAGFAQGEAGAEGAAQVAAPGAPDAQSRSQARSGIDGFVDISTIL